VANIDNGYPESTLAKEMKRLKIKICVTSKKDNLCPKSRCS